MIDKAVKLLNTRGILYVETPNLDSHLFNVEKYNYTFLTPPDHIWLFSQKSFRYLFHKISRIQMEKISTYSYPEHFMGIIKNLINQNRSADIRKNQMLDNSDKSDRSDLSGLSDASGIRLSPTFRSFPNYSEMTLKNAKYYLFDRLLSPLLTPFLNLGNNGSILELYIRKK